MKVKHEITRKKNWLKAIVLSELFFIILWAIIVSISVITRYETISFAKEDAISGLITCTVFAIILGLILGSEWESREYTIKHKIVK